MAGEVGQSLVPRLPVPRTLSKKGPLSSRLLFGVSF